MLRFIFPIEFEANIYALSRLVRRKKNRTFRTKAQKSGALNLPYLNRNGRKRPTYRFMWCSLKRTKLTIHHVNINKNRYIWTRTAFEWFPCIALNKFKSLHRTKSSISEKLPFVWTYKLVSYERRRWWRWQQHTHFLDISYKVLP